MALKLITPASTYPVTLAEAKLHLRVDGTDEDTLITALITAATEMAEQETGRALMTQTWELTQDAFDSAMVLTRTPVASITSIKYIDLDGVEQTLNGANYTLYSTDDYGYHQVTPAYGLDWPETRIQDSAVAVRYVAGYTTVPQPIKQWILLMIGSMYDNRESETTQNPTKHRFVDRLLDRYKVYPV
jgi:uncharacterized phiE125 gp8 family phage protein